MTPSDFAQMLGEAADRLDNGSLEDSLRATLEPFHEGIEENFLRAEDAGGTPWPLRKDKKPHPLLILSGKLIEAARDTGNPGNIHDVDADGRTLLAGVRGDVVPYAAAQNFGFPPRNLPARTYEYASQDTLERCAQRFAARAQQQLFPEDWTP